MAKRIYKNTVLRWAENNKYIVGGTATVGTLVGLYFLYLSFIGAILITGYSGDTICAGTLNDPCYAFVNFTAQEDIFIYPLDYDPYNRDIGVSFDPNVKDWKMERSWGSGWREIKLDDTCKGTWCGGKFGAKTNVYSFAFREGRDYQIRITAYKEDPRQDIKWAFGPVDPIFLGINKDNIFPKLISNEAGLTGGEAIFEIVNPIDNLNLSKYFKFIFIEAEGTIDSFEYFINYSESYDVPVYGEIKNIQSCIRENNITGLNESYDCSTIEQYIQSYETKQRESWKKPDVIDSGIYKIKIVGHWKAQLGERAIDWQPEIIYPKELVGFTEDIYLRKSQWAWWNNSWNYKRELTNITGDYARLNITHDSDMQADCDDVRFLDSAEGTELGYVLTNKSNSVWCDFRVDVDQNNTIWMYYGNADVTTTSSATDVWGSSLVNYYGFEETTGVVDDFNDGNYLTNNNAIRGVSGFIGNSFHFDGINDYVLGDSGITGDTTVTMSCWINATSSAGDDGFFTVNSNAGVSSSGFAAATHDGNYEVVVEGVAWGSAGTSITINSWHNVLVTRSGSSYSLFLDGESFASSSGTIGGGTFSNQTQIASRSAPGITFFLGGRVDECAIFNSVLTSAQRFDLYNSTEPSYVLGAEQSQDFEAPTITLLAPDDDSVLITPTIFAANVFDNIAVDTVILYGNYSGDWEINSTNSSGLNNTNYNFTLGLADGAYLWAYWANDTVGNGTFSANRTVNIDSTVPFIDFNDTGTEANATIKRQDYVYANVTVTEANEDTIVFAIFNGSGVVNSTQFTSDSIRVINWTGLIDGIYEYNVTVNDTVGNENQTETRTIYL
ncbi:hypothetical protein LCGC14_1297630, partial [marine sediment metagenome]